MYMYVCIYVCLFVCVHLLGESLILQTAAAFRENGIFISLLSFPGPLSFIDLCDVHCVTASEKGPMALNLTSVRNF